MFLATPAKAIGSGGEAATAALLFLHLPNLPTRAKMFTKHTLNISAGRGGGGGGTHENERKPTNTDGVDACAMFVAAGL